MESRKVQRVGYSTYSVSLPKNWVRESGLKQGDLVMLTQEKDGSLKLVPSSLVERKAQTEECVINSDMCTDPGMLERIIVGNYTLGLDSFSVVSSTRISREHVDEVRQITHRLIGLGIVQETSERIDLQCSVDPTKFKVDMLMRRLVVIASTIYSEAMQALAESDRELAEDAIRREDEADMMYWLAIRLLLSAQRDRMVADKIGLEEPTHILYYALISRYLEVIADHAESIARRAVEFKGGERKGGRQTLRDIGNLSELAHNVFLKSMDCVFSGDIDVANNVLEITRVIGSESEKLLKALPEMPILRTIVLELAIIADTGAGIAVIAINKALEKSSKICSIRKAPV